VTKASYFAMIKAMAKDFLFEATSAIPKHWRALMVITRKSA